MVSGNKSRQKLDMEDELSEESGGEYEWVFTKMEIKLSDISCNMSILMEVMGTSLDLSVIL